MEKKLFRIIAKISANGNSALPREKPGTVQSPQAHFLKSSQGNVHTYSWHKLFLRQLVHLYSGTTLTSGTGVSGVGLVTVPVIGGSKLSISNKAAAANTIASKAMPQAGM